MKKSTLLVCLLVMLMSALCFGQTAASTQEVHAYDTIDLATLGVSINFNAVSRGGPVPDSLSFSGQFNVTPPSGLGAFLDPSYFPVQPVYSVLLGSLKWGSSQVSSCGTGNGSTTRYSNPYFQEAGLGGSGGPVHQLPAAWYWFLAPRGTCVQPTSQAGYALDNSGIYVDSVAFTYATPSGMVFGASGGLSVETDPNGNSASSATTSLGAPFLTFGTNTYSYNDASGNPQSYSLTSSNVPVRSNWNCATGHGDYNDATPPYPLVSSVGFPDGTSLGITYEPTAGFSGDVTGRIQKLTLPTLGTITFGYSGGDAVGPGTGVFCISGRTPVLTRTLSDGSAWTYTQVPPSNSAPQVSTTTVTDPSGNNVVHTFFYSTILSVANTPVEVQTQFYQGGGVNCVSGCTSANLLKTVTYCYNNLTTFANCANPTASPFNYPSVLVSGTYVIKITEQDVYTTLPTLGPSEVATSFDGYGNATSVKRYDFGASTPADTTTITYGTYNSGSCNTVGSQILNRPCEVIESAGGNTVSDTRYTYDSNGNNLSIARWTGTTWLTSSATYNANGTVNTATDAAGTLTSYGYDGSCNGLVPTSITSDALSTTVAWDCVGDIPLAATDSNGAVASNSYTAGGADPFYGRKSSTNPLGAVSTDTYTSKSHKSAMSVGTSTSNTTNFVDTLGRTFRTQTKHGSVFDIVTTNFSWGTLGAVRTISSVPYSGAGNTNCSGTCPVDTTNFDGLGRVASFVDALGKTVTNTYTGKDALTVVTPTPTGENAKKVQVEFDGLGRTVSSCAILTSGGSSCGQATGGYSGIPTTFTYTPLAGGFKTQTTNGAQTVTVTKDALGRTLTVNSPDAGTIQYVYDAQSATCSSLVGNWPSPGDVVETVDNAGSHTCFVRDSQHRITGVNTTGPNGHCIRYRYDNSTGVLGAPPTGVVSNNSIGRLTEAETDDCTFPITQASIITDEWFSYDDAGNITDVWQSTPNSGGYYHSSATYFTSGDLNTLSLPGYPTITYGLDADGKPATVSSGATAVIGGVSYGTFVNPTSVTVGASDTDTYTYDNEGNLKTYAFAVNGKSQGGTFTWNANSTLNNLVITDTFNAGGAQTCNFVYDDIVRLVSDNCGAKWTQTFSYDRYGNITKSGSLSWACSTCYNTANNHYSTSFNGSITYDANGRLTFDSFNYYGWDGYGKLVTVGQNPVCGTSGTCLTYDAEGRVVEKSVGATVYEYVVSPIGKVGTWIGANSQYTFLPLPGGGVMHSTGASGSTINIQRLVGGSSPLETGLSSRAFTYDRAFAVYGETYDKFGTGTEVLFRGDEADLDAVQFLFGTYHSSQGRSIQPPYQQ